MTTKLKVQSATLELRTVKMSKAILKQIPRLNYAAYRNLLDGKGNFDAEKVVGWIHGTALGDEWKRWLLVSTGEGEYGLVEMMEWTIKAQGYKQLYVA